MNRINELFNKKKSNILSVYFCAGFPQLNNVEPTLKALQDNGVDMVEIGIPFSDPMADGPVIQNASSRALKNGMSLKKLFAQLKDIRNEINIPLVMMGYLNPIVQYGFREFCISCKEVGIDGMIIPDLPFNEYMDDYKEIAAEYNLKMIMLITPETSSERIQHIDQNTDGFIYMVSSASTTGSQSKFDEQKEEYFRRINEMRLNNPRMIGFGISNKQTFDMACNYASGAIIGSKFVTLMEKNEGDANKAAKELISALE